MTFTENDMNNMSRFMHLIMNEKKLKSINNVAFVNFAVINATGMIKNCDTHKNSYDLAIETCERIADGNDEFFQYDEEEDIFTDIVNNHKKTFRLIEEIQ